MKNLSSEILKIREQSVGEVGVQGWRQFGHQVSGYIGHMVRDQVFHQVWGQIVGDIREEFNQ